MSRIGKKYILWRVEYRLDAYRDHLERAHEGFVVLEEIPVTVIELKEVRGMWSNDTYTGYKAVSEDGEEFTCNWGSFPDDSMTPTFYWDGRKDYRGTWVPEDAFQRVNMKIFPCVTETGERAIPTGALYCEKHDHYYLEECIGCRLDATIK